MTTSPNGAPPGPSLTPAAIYEMMLAYKSTALLRTAVELGVFDCLATGRLGASDVAQQLRLDPRGTRLLLNALAAIGLVRCDGPEYWLAADAAALLVRGSSRYVGDMAKVMSSHWEWDALQQLPDAVRRGGTVLAESAETPRYEYWEDFAAYAGAVAGPTAERVADILAPWAAARSRLHVLDVACGHGLYGFTIAGRQPHARVWSQDWENVLPITVDHARRLGLADQVSTIGGDMFEVPLGGPYDVVLLTNILHHFSERRGGDLLARARAALSPSGKVVLVGFTVEDGPPAQDAQAHLFSILMLVWTFAGEVHSTAIYRKMLADAGFGNAQLHQVPGLPLRIMVADA